MTVGTERFPTLFSPIRIGSRTAKNRIMNPAHTTGYARSGAFTDRLIDYHRARARGGAGVIVTQPNYVTAEHGGLHSVGDDILPWYERLAEAVHAEGALVIAQLSHPGRQGSYSGEGAPLHVAPSAVPARVFGQRWRIPHELEEAEIEGVVRAFTAAAVRALRGGLDGIELHYAHGNLVDQFLTPSLNERTDRWGGTVENRLRLGSTILQEIREAVGDALVVGVRLNGPDRGRSGVSDLERLEIAGSLASTGLVDYVSATVGHYSDALETARNVPDMSFPPGAWASRLREVTHVVDVPVALVGRINHPAVAESLLAGGDCELVAMARALIADPDLPRKALSGRVAEIRPCVGAVEGCWGNVFEGRDMRCIHNPTVGREARWDETPSRADTKKRVVVVGGGPAGLEAARVAALRGHDVVLLEREHQLGGQVTIAARAPHRSELAGSIEWFEQECSRLGVEVRLGVTARPAAVLELAPDAIVVATGSREPTVAVPSTATVRVVTARDVLGGDVRAVGRVVVYDESGGWPGLGAAEALAAGGASVEIVTPMTYVGQGVNPFLWRTVYARLLALGVAQRPLWEMRAVVDDGLEIAHAFTGEEAVVPADLLVMAALPRADLRLYEELRRAGPKLLLVGDAVAPRGMEHATYDGHEAGLAV